PQLRTIQIREPSHDLDAYRERVFKPLRGAGRRIALDPDEEIAEAARAEGVAIRRSQTGIPGDEQGWPPNFEIEAPADYASHSEFYWLWGRLGYSGGHDPKSTPDHAESPEEMKAAAQIVSALAIARGAASEWKAAIPAQELANVLNLAA